MIKNIKNIIITPIVIFILSIQTNAAFQMNETYKPVGAGSKLDQITGDTTGLQIFAGETLSTFFQVIANSLIKFLAPVAFIMLIFGGIMMALSVGNDTKMKQATKIVTFAIVGLVVAILSWSIISIITNEVLPDIVAQPPAQ